MSLFDKMKSQLFFVSPLGKVLQAELVLKKIRGGADVRKELAGIINSCQKDSEKGKRSFFL